MGDHELGKDTALARHLLTSRAERADCEAAHPEGQDTGGDGDHPGLGAVRGGRDPGKKDSQKAEEDALRPALRSPRHAASLLVVLVVVLGCGLLRLGVLAILERLVGHAWVMPEKACLQSSLSPGA